MQIAKIGGNQAMSKYKYPLNECKQGLYTFDGDKDFPSMQMVFNASGTSCPPGWHRPFSGNLENLEALKIAE